MFSTLSEVYEFDERVSVFMLICLYDCVGSECVYECEWLMNVCIRVCKCS